MSNITGITRGGTAYTPEFIMTLDQTKCIGCGRCFKTCPRDVFDLVDREGMDLTTDDDEYGDDDDWDDDDGFSDDASMVMSLKDALDCIGCKACIKVCPKACMTHEAQPPA